MPPGRSETGFGRRKRRRNVCGKVQDTINPQWTRDNLPKNNPAGGRKAGPAGSKFYFAYTTTSGFCQVYKTFPCADSRIQKGADCSAPLSFSLLNNPYRPCRREASAEPSSARASPRQGSPWPVASTCASSSMRTIPMATTLHLCRLVLIFHGDRHPRLRLAQSVPGTQSSIPAGCMHARDSGPDQDLTNAIACDMLLISSGCRLCR
jgi:hypothetical protein